MMVDLFSSREATAVANLFVFAGLTLAAWRVGRAWVSRVLSRFSATVRKIQQHQILAELKKVRIYRSNKFAAVKDTAYGIFDDVMINVTLLALMVAALSTAISINANSDVSGPEGDIWTLIYGDHVYWVTVMTVAGIGVLLLATAFFWGTRMQLRFLRYAADPDESRRKLIDRYLKLRSLR